MTDNVKPGRLTKKFQHEKRHKRRRKRIWQENAHHFYHPFGYYPVDKHGRYTENEDEIAYYKRYDSFEKSRAYLKRQSNKRARKYKDELTNPGDYRRVFDYWWELY